LRCCGAGSKHSRWKIPLAEPLVVVSGKGIVMRIIF